MPTQYTLHQYNKKALFGQEELKLDSRPNFCLNFMLERLILWDGGIFRLACHDNRLDVGTLGM